MNWKFIQTLCIFYALFVCTFFICAETSNENNDNLGSVGSNIYASPTSENIQSELHSVLLKNLKNNQSQKKILLDLKTFVPNGYDKSKIVLLNNKLLEYLRRSEYEGNILLNEFNRFCSYIHDAVYKLSISEDEKLKIETRIDELKAAAEKYGIQINSYQAESAKKSCRVLKINDDLGVVILPIGYSDGIRVGRDLQIPNAGNARATIISVRKFVSAAVLTEGLLKNVSPGMLVKL